MLKGHEISSDLLVENSVEFLNSVFCLGADYNHLRDYIKELDTEKNLGVGSVIHSTPAHFVTVPTFHMSRRMISNQEYLDFLNAPLPEGIEGNCDYFIEHPVLWMLCWDQAKIGTMFYNLYDGITQKTWYEFYGNCENAIQALLRSFYFEVFRTFKLPFKMEGDGEAEIELSEDIQLKEIDIYHANEYIFKGLTYFFAPFYNEAEVEKVRTEIIERDGGFENFKSIFMQYLDQLREWLTTYFIESCDPKVKDVIIHNPTEIEILQIFSRIAKQVAILNEHETLQVRTVFFPRFWKTLGDSSQNRTSNLKGFKGLQKQIMKVANVPWFERPLWGISMYEALAYTIWLTQLIDDDYTVTLPTEAEYERAASWPKDNYQLVSDFKMTVNIFDKCLFPWEPEHWDGHDDDEFRDPVKDFSAYFGNQSRSLEGFYFQDNKIYKKLLRDTARKINDNPDDRIEQLCGFGWQWTCDRFNPNEMYYNRFQGQVPVNLKVYKEGKNDETEPVKVFEFFAHGDNPLWSHFVCRGSGEIVGGPGTTTRRIAMCPFRGYKQLGFRWVLRPTDIDTE